MTRWPALGLAILLFAAYGCDPKDRDQTQSSSSPQDRDSGYRGGGPAGELIQRLESAASGPAAQASDPGRCTFDNQCLSYAPETAGVFRASPARTIRYTASGPRVPSDLRVAAPPPPAVSATLWQRFQTFVRQYSRGQRPEAHAVMTAAERAGVDKSAALAIALQESGVGAIRRDSSAGAQGVMQVMPKTACSEFGVCDEARRKDTAVNASMGVQYFKKYAGSPVNAINPFDPLDAGRLACAAASYNAGPGAVSRHGCDVPYRETREYVRNVVEYAKLFKQHFFGARAEA